MATKPYQARPNSLDPVHESHIRQGLVRPSLDKTPVLTNQDD